MKHTNTQSLKSLPHTSVFLAASLDGYIARADGAIDWLEMVEREGEDYGTKEFFASVDTLVMGSKTYDVALGFSDWPYANMRCIVVTTNTSRPALHGEEFFSGELAPLWERLGREGSKKIYVDGGTIIAQALKAKLVHELTVSMIPILLGTGTPLAPEIGHDVILDLTQHRAFESGLVQLTYQVRSESPGRGVPST